MRLFVCANIIYGWPLRRSLTNDEGGDEAGGDDGRVALWPERLQQVVGEGEGGDGVAGRDDDEEGGPQVQERRQGAEGLGDVRVVTAGLEKNTTLTRLLVNPQDENCRNDTYDSNTVETV